MGERRWGNFSSCCRLCLSEKLGTLKSIFEDATRSRDTVKNIQTFIGIEVKASDRLSTMICDQCLTKVTSWHDFKKTCSENQSKLIGWMNAWNCNVADISIHIKDEVVEDGEDHSPPQVIVDDDDEVRVKPELIETIYEPEAEAMDDEDMYDFPPPLTPHPPEEQIRALNDMDDDDDDDDDEHDNLSSNIVEINGFLNSDTSGISTPKDDGRNCPKCDKVFSSVGNRRKHEAMIHRRQEQAAKNNEREKLKEKRDGSSTSRGTPTISENDVDLQKIQFAAGLRLQQRSSAEHVGNMPLTKVEVSYLEKCKTIVKMTQTLICACHDEQYEDVRDLYAHLKKQRTWFAMYTCYNCLITFGTRSSYMKHFCHCPKELLQNLKRLSESPVNPEIKMRLYQSFKCIRCDCIFSFHEDFCSHFDVEHMEMLQNSPPYTCLCSQSFNEVEDYKQHLHITCFLRYFCDVCFEVFPTTDAFRIHCEKIHDNAEGDSLESFDYFHKTKLGSEDAEVSDNIRNSLPPEIKKKEELEETRTRRRTIQLPVGSDVNTPPHLEIEDPNYNGETIKVINPHALHNIKSSKPTSCPTCGKAYSSYHNMLRHYKLSHDESGKILECIYCQERFRLITELKEHEATVHASDKQTEEANKNQFKFSCPDCGKLLKNMDDWTKHMESHPKKCCTECSKEFVLQSELDQHRSAHLNIKLYRDAKTKGYKSTMVSPPILICEICDKTFSTKSELRQHKLLHEKMPVLSAQDGGDAMDEKKDLSRKYSCTTCNKHYVSYGGIWDHNRKHHAGQQIAREYPRQCNLCDKTLTSRGAWVNHQRMHERLQNEGMVLKKTNQYSTPLARPVKARAIKTDDDESYYTCKKCFKVFSSKCNLRNHMKCHGINLNPSRSSSKTGKIIKTYWCDICHQACPGYAELQEHKQEHLNENMPNLTNEEDLEDPLDLKRPFVFTCDVCTLTFATNFALKRHKEKHMEQGETVVKQVSVYCKYCKIPFASTEELGEHMTNEHDQVVVKSKSNKPPSGRKFPCRLCKKVFDNAGALSSHQGWHKRGKVEKKARSEEKIFRTMVKQIPKSNVSQESSKYQCYTCSLCFVNDTALQIHILETHRNINTTVLAMNCNSCKLNFDSKSAYDTHMQLHQVVENQKSLKPHPCKYCSAAFSRSDTLNAHVRQHHKEHYRDTFKCTQCDRVFDKQNALTIHLKVHDRQRLSGDSTPKPIHNKNIYFCSICDLGFAIAKDLRTHVVTAHPF